MGEDELARPRVLAHDIDELFGLGQRTRQGKDQPADLLLVRGRKLLDHSEGAKHEEPDDQPDEHAGDRGDELLSRLHPY